MSTLGSPVPFAGRFEGELEHEPNRELEHAANSLVRGERVNE